MTKMKKTPPPTSTKCTTSNSKAARNTLKTHTHTHTNNASHSRVLRSGGAFAKEAQSAHKRVRRSANEKRALRSHSAARHLPSYHQPFSWLVGRCGGRENYTEYRLGVGRSAGALLGSVGGVGGVWNRRQRRRRRQRGVCCSLCRVLAGTERIRMRRRACVCV